MAHALHFENMIVNDEHDFFETSLLKKWNKLAVIEMEHIQKEENSFFRKYGATNPHEFFAVAVENFFERPQEFSDHSPELFRTLTSLLNQDPLGRLA